MEQVSNSMPCTGLISLHRIQLIGQRIAWKSPLTFDGPKFRVQIASKYPRISVGSRCSNPRNFNTNQPADQLPRRTNFCVGFHRVPQTVGTISCVGSFQRSSEINCGHALTDEMSEKNNSISPGSFEVQATPCSPKSRDKFKSILAYTGPVARSSDLWSLTAGGEKLPEFQRKLENHAIYLRSVLSTDLLAQDPYKIWMLKATQDKLVILNEIWRKMVSFNGVPSAGIALVSVCLEPLLARSPSEGRFTCDKFDAFFRCDNSNEGTWPRHTNDSTVQ
jgi:hypothetical protein